MPNNPSGISLSHTEPLAPAPSLDNVVVMGVAGCGKSTLGAALAAHLGMAWIEGDSHHSAGNLLKMAAGVALTDADRFDWLAKLAHLLSTQHHTVLACSALKRSYRDQLRTACPEVRFVYLSIGLEDALMRVQHRSGKSTHFFSASLVQSQFDALQAPNAPPATGQTLMAEPDVLTLPATAELPDLVQQAAQWLLATQPTPTEATA